MKAIQTIGLGGGCHWCTEAVFQQLRGVSSVRQGYIKSIEPYDSWSEAILLDYDPDQLAVLVLRIDPTKRSVESSRRFKITSSTNSLSLESISS